MRDDRLEDVAHLEVVRVALVVEDVAAGDRRLVEVPDQRLLAQRQIAEAVGVDLHDGGFADPLEQVRAIGGATVVAGAGVRLDPYLSS